MNGVTVEALTGDRGLQIEVLAGAAGLRREITGARIQKPGLALAGYPRPVHPGRVQILGFSEISYLATLDPDRQAESAEGLCGAGPPCLLLTRGLEAPDALRDACDRHRLALLRTPLMSSVAIHRVTSFLESRLSPTTTVHGVLVDVFGVGVLLLGKTGIGKSEAALELVMKGHRLVADDAVNIRFRPPDTLSGQATELLKHMIEVRGLGILNIEHLFGASAVRDVKRVELVFELMEWEAYQEYDRVGGDEHSYAILGVELPRLRVPLRPGRNIASIIEVAARNEILKRRGRHSAREFEDKLTAALARARVASDLDDVE